MLLTVRHHRDLEVERRFERVLVPDLLSLDDIQAVLEGARAACAEGAVIELRWACPLRQWLGGVGPNRLGWRDVAQLCRLADLEVLRLKTPRLGTQRAFCRPAAPAPSRDVTCSVIVPTRNEAGHVDDAVMRTPTMGAWTEIVFVDGASTDGTVERIEQLIAAHPTRRIRLVHQGGEDGGGGTMLPAGKVDAVRKGFAAAQGDVVMILDGDLTVAPEDLPRFFDALTRDKGGFVNGNRLLYPMERDAMQPVNWLGNHFFGWVCARVMRQHVKDALCGTKAMWRADYARLLALFPAGGSVDPFGDFELLFGAAALGLQVVNVPVRYRARRYGVSKILNRRDAPKLFRMVWWAFWRLRGAKLAGSRPA